MMSLYCKFALTYLMSEVFVYSLVLSLFMPLISFLLLSEITLPTSQLIWRYEICQRLWILLSSFIFPLTFIMSRHYDVS